MLGRPLPTVLSWNRRGMIVNVPLSEGWQRFVRDEVLNGRFPSEAAVVEEALALLKYREPIRQGRESGGETEPIGRIIDQLMADLPDEVLDRLPVDGAAQHDHHVYGTPKRPS